jgi:hypothetical protein
MGQDADANPLTKPSSLLFLAVLGLLCWLVGSGRQQDDKEAVARTQPMDTSLKKWVGHWTKDTDVAGLGTALDLYEEDGMLAGHETYTYIAPLHPLILHERPKYLTNIKKVDENTITYDIVGVKRDEWTCPMRKIVWSNGDIFPSAKYHVFKNDGSLVSEVGITKR